MPRPENIINQSRPGHHAPFSALLVLISRRVNQLTQILVLAWTALSAGLAMSDGQRLSGFSAGDTVSIQAENAWEDVVPDTIHFSGHFELKAHDWYLSADHATLYGDLEDPETAILTGAPATIQLETVSHGLLETITGKAARIVYWVVRNISDLGGGAIPAGG